MQEDDDLQIEIEALKVESETCIANLNEKKGQLMSMSESIAKLMESDYYYSVGEVDYSQLNDIDQILNDIKTKVGREKL